MHKSGLFISIAIIVLLAASMILAGSQDAKKSTLGRLLYFDTNLSTPPGQSCASCHAPGAGWADPDDNLPVSEGVISGRFGNRNSPTAAYAAYSPSFHFDAAAGLYIGGQFWDGRAATLADQAKGPFLNALEMNNPDMATVVTAVENSSYASLLLMVYGQDAFANVETAYNNIANAIAAFESTRELLQFSSKYDFYLKRAVNLTPQEAEGLALFDDPAKGNCAACHPSAGTKALFTDFSYDNLGVPKNPDNPFYDLPPQFNPDGDDWVDLGLGGVLGDPNELGKMKVPTLRNIAVTAPYGHNGYFATLDEIVHFYNTAGDGTWPAPEVAENVNRNELGALGLTAPEEAAIVAFLHTLTDGYSLGKPLAELNPIMDGMSFDLAQNYPNPFNPMTQIEYAIPATKSEGVPVRLTIYNMLGEVVRTLVDERQYPGLYAVTWDATDMSANPAPSGLYIYRLDAGEFRATRRMVLLK